ncbi:hypothetical protein [Tahibacter amnicola]|uniref:Uncharacterized protein n=1 Tax=Tahibacter amnicola TaxID=2976241 RepID=A0ABY6BGW7_9GAMM|nr:hypothetical protein [Tahibacter amnicola]UXI68563.1 hypothetical protein N4264_02600 [Tahibacter amnicola]
MSESDDRLHEYLRAGIVANDVPALFPLLKARELLRAFSTLFHGGEDAVLVRLLVLRTIGERGHAPDWSPQELREHFAYIDATKLDTVLLRLRDNGLLAWESETQRYRISPVGRQALSALSLLLQFQGEGEELAYVTAQLAAGETMGRVGTEDLQHLLSRLNELRDDFDRAVLSGSEHRIRAAAATLKSVWRWVEKGTEVVRLIAQDGEIDPATHRVAQQIGRAQSAMLRQASVFQRALNQLDRHRVHLGGSGLSSSDVNRWLRSMDIPALAAVADGMLAERLAPAFILGDIALDIADYELVEREREGAEEAVGLPPAQGAPEETRELAASADFSLAEAWYEDLANLAGPVSLAALVPHADFATSAYRLSLLGLLGDPGAESRVGALAALARLPLRLTLSGTLEGVDGADVGQISAGHLLSEVDKNE